MGRLLFDRDRFALRFHYPDTLFLTTKVTFERQTGSGAGLQKVALFAYGDNMIIVTRQDLDFDFAFAEWEQVQARMDNAIAELMPEALPGHPVGHAGTRGMEYTAENDDGLRQWVTLMFDHAVQYNVNCQSTPDGRAEIQEAGEMVFATMEHRLR